MTKKKIVIITPLFNEEANVDPFFDAFLNLKNKLKKIDLDLLFVNDGSSDGSEDKINKLTKYKFVKSINFSKNFGKESALSAGLIETKDLYDAVITVDSDLQHPLTIIPKFIDKWVQGSMVVIGVRRNHAKNNLFKYFGSIVYYKLKSFVGKDLSVPFSTDYRLIDKSAQNAFLGFNEVNRVYRDIVDALGFKRDYIYFNAAQRNAGAEVYSISKLIAAAITGILSNTTAPLVMIAVIGISIFLVSLVILFWMTLNYFFMSFYEYTPLAIFTVMNTTMSGMILFSIGLLGLYIGKIFKETASRPIYIIKDKKNF